MIVGCLGDISFAVFDSHVETIKNMVQNVSARYTTHQRAGGPALTEFTVLKQLRLTLNWPHTSA